MPTYQAQDRQIIELDSALNWTVLSPPNPVNDTRFTVKTVNKDLSAIRIEFAELIESYAAILVVMPLAVVEFVYSAPQGTWYILWVLPPEKPTLAGDGIGWVPSGGTLDATYKTADLTFDPLLTTYFDTDDIANTFTARLPGKYQLIVSGVFENNSLNAGRTTNIRVYDTVALAGGTPMLIATGRNVEATPFTAALLVNVDISLLNHPLTLEFGGGDDYSAVVFNTLNLQMVAIDTTLVFPAPPPVYAGVFNGIDAQATMTAGLSLTGTDYTIGIRCKLRSNGILLGDAADTRYAMNISLPYVYHKPDTAGAAWARSTYTNLTGDIEKHIVVRRNGAGNDVTFFEDGVPLVSEYNGTIPDQPSTPDMFAAYNGGSLWCNCDIIECQAFDRALTDQEIADWYAGTIPATPAHNYPFDENGGSLITDTVAGNNATAVNMTWVELFPAPDYIWNFNGSTSQVVVPNLAFASEATLLLKVKLDVATPAAAAQTGIAEFTSLSAATHYPFTDGNAYISIFRNGTRITCPPNGAVTRTDWHWLIVRADNANGWECLQALTDGTLYTIGTASNTVFTSFTKLAIGASLDVHFLQGQVDRALVFDKRLSDAAIQAVIAGGSDTGAMLIYETNENGGSTAIDSSGNGNDGVMTDVTWSVLA